LEILIYLILHIMNWKDLEIKTDFIFIYNNYLIDNSIFYLRNDKSTALFFFIV
jgi:hypothetical protein